MKQVERLLLTIATMLIVNVCTFGQNSAILKGDVNNDGVVDNADFIATLRHTIGSTPSVFNRDAADVNQDGEINNADAIMILRMTIN